MKFVPAGKKKKKINFGEIISPSHPFFSSSPPPFPSDARVQAGPGSLPLEQGLPPRYVPPPRDEHLWELAAGSEARRWRGVVPFVALLLLQRRPVAGRALLVTGPGCPGHGLCRSNVQEQTRRQVALLNATAQDLFSLYLKCQGEPFSSETDRLCNPSGVFFPAFRVNRTSERKEVMVAMYKLFAFLNASLGNITRDQEELNPTAKELLDRLHNTTKTTRGLISNLTCLLCKNYNVFQVDVSYGESSKGKSAFKKKQQGCQVLRKYVQVIAQAARVLLPHLSPP
ncbi:leukemia inhibitory factor isoform 1-T1 [Morphnus guianensis]